MQKDLDDDKAAAAKALWSQYKQNPSKSVRRLLIQQYSPLVHHAARAQMLKRPPNLDYDDLVSAGMVGLLDAIERFDPDNESKAQFQTYAPFRIRGAIVDEIRRMEWTPRTVQAKIRNVMASIEKHYASSSTAPTIEEIALGADITEEEAAEAMLNMQRTYFVHMEHEILEQYGPTTEATDGALEKAKEIRRVIKENLTPRERQYIASLYFFGYSPREIAKTMQMTLSEAALVKASAEAKLRDALNREDS